MMVRKFWWGQWGDQRKIHWKNWKSLCNPKALGGMGFKDLEKFNEAMLAKQVWRLLVDHSSLFYRVFRAKYFPSGSVFYAQVSSGSYAWRSIMKARTLVQLGLLWRIGNGMKINIYNDRWLPGGGTRLALYPRRKRRPQIGLLQICCLLGGMVGMSRLLMHSSYRLKHTRSRASLFVSQTKRTALHGQGVGQAPIL